MAEKYCKQIQNKSTSSKKELFFLAICALCAGLVNGFLGTGGGIILILALSRLELGERDRFATVIAAILPMSLVSTLLYGQDFGKAEKWLLPGIIGGVTGAFLLDKISTKLLKKLFALMVIWAGVCFIK